MEDVTVEVTKAAESNVGWHHIMMLISSGFFALGAAVLKFVKPRHSGHANKQNIDMLERLVKLESNSQNDQETAKEARLQNRKTLGVLFKKIERLDEKVDRKFDELNTSLRDLLSK